MRNRSAKTSRHWVSTSPQPKSVATDEQKIEIMDGEVRIMSYTEGFLRGYEMVKMLILGFTIWSASDIVGGSSRTISSTKWSVSLWILSDAILGIPGWGEIKKNFTDSEFEHREWRMNKARQPQEQAPWISPGLFFSLQELQMTPPDLASLCMDNYKLHPSN